MSPEACNARLKTFLPTKVRSKVPRRTLAKEKVLLVQNHFSYECILYVYYNIIINQAWNNFQFIRLHCPFMVQFERIGFISSMFCTLPWVQSKDWVLIHISCTLLGTIQRLYNF